MDFGMFTSVFPKSNFEDPHGKIMGKISILNMAFCWSLEM